MYSAWLAPVRAQLPADFSAADAAALSQAITQEALRRFGDFLAGVQAYQSSAVPLRQEPALPRLLWQQGTTRLLDYSPFGGQQAPRGILFVVPSLINRFEILDLDEDRSFVRFLAAQGYRPMVIDWGEPSNEEESFSLTDYILRRLEPALEVAKAQGGGLPCHLLGYCMGGVFALALAVRKQACFASLTLMATPWDFAVAPVGGVPVASSFAGQMFLNYARVSLSCLKGMNALHPAFLEAVFAGFHPLPVLQKFMHFAASGLSDDKIRRFVLTEDWLNNGVPLALPVAQECLELWYAQNVLARKAWKVGETLVDPSVVALPCCLMIPLDDKVVPPESAMPLARALPHATLIQPDTGHLGLMVSGSAPERVWEPFIAWLAGKKESSPRT